MLNQRQDDERARLKAAGFTDAEIDAELGAAKPTRPPVRVASESTAMQGPGKAPARAATDLKTAIGTARALAQGATFGFGDELEAGARSLAGAPYKATRDQIRGEQAAYAEAHPVAAIGAELAGGLLTGGAALKAAQGAGTAARVARVLAPKVAEGAGVAARLGAAAKSGGAAGALLGAGNAAEARDIVPEGAKGAAIGAAGGVAVGTLAEAIRGARNLLGGAVAGAERIGRRGVVGRAIEAESPEQAGVRRTLNAARRGGQTLDDLEARSAVAPDEATLGSLIDRGQGTRAERIMRNVGRERDAIDASLAERSAETPAMWYRTLQRETGVDVPRDPKAVLEAGKMEAQQRSKPIYDAATDGVTISDPRVLDLLERPSAGDAFDASVRGMRDRGKVVSSRREILRAAKPSPVPPDVEVPGVAARGPSEDELASMTLDELRKYQRGPTSLDRLTDSELQAQRVYLQQMDAKDAGLAAIRDSQDYAEYLALRDAGNHEDARGVMERMGYFDPREFNQAVARDAAGAAKRMSDRAGTLRAVEEEMARRRALVGEVPPDALPVTASRMVPSEAAVSVPEPEQAARLVRMDARMAQRWKFELDDELERLEGKEGGKASQRYAEVKALRDEVENLLYEHANTGENGENLWGKAQRTYAEPRQRAESWVFGNKVEQAGTADGVARLAREAYDPEAFRQGAASKLLERAAGVADGEAGQTRNPVAGPLGSPTRRARTRAAFPDDASFERARADAEQIVRYLQEQRAVSGNSATAGNLSEIADEFGVDVSTILQNATSPTKLALALFKDRARGAVSGMNASQATAAGRMLFSGLPGQQPRTKALATMRELAPAIEALMVRQATLRGQVGARATDRMRR